MYKKIILIFGTWIGTFIFVTGISYGQSGWIQSELNVSMGYCLSVTDSIIFASTTEGVYSTTDNGMPWFSKGPTGQSVYDIIKSNQYILAATDKGIYRSSDNGGNWLPTNGSPTFSGTGGTIGPHLFAKNSSYVFVIAWALGIFRSSDDGQNWQQVYVGQDAPGFQDYASGATCIGKIGERIIIGVSLEQPVYFTTDNGNTWTHPQFSRSDGMSDQLLCFYNDNGKLFAGGFLGLYFSPDSGNSWSTQYMDTIDTHGEVIGLGIFRDIISYNQYLVANVDFHSIQISGDNGKSWSSFNDGLISDWTFSALAIKSPYIWDISQFGNAYRRLLTEVVTGVNNFATSLPNQYLLSQNYPNPFNPTTNINFSIPQTSFVTLKVYDILGKEVTTLVNEEKPAGNYKVKFNAAGLTSGVYFYRLQTKNYTNTKKFILMK